MPKTGLWMAPILSSKEPKTIKHATTGKPTKKPAIEGYVMKLNGKVVSDRKLQLRAFRWAAVDLTRQGLGGGIVVLLLPRSDEQLKQLAKDRSRYTLDRVRKRQGGRREALRLQALSPVLLRRLRDISPAQPNWKKKQFVDWLVSEIKIKGSAARNVIVSEAPGLLKEMRSYGWWYRLIEMKKMSR
jgi:hypothetical protein